MAHDDRDHRKARAPERLVDEHRRAVAQEFTQHVHAGAEDGVLHERHRAAAERVGERDDELHHAGQKRRYRRTRDAEHGQTELAEDQHIVAERVAEHRDREDDHAEARIFDAALHADVDGGKRVENVGEADDAQVRLGQLHECQIVGDEVEHLRGKRAQNGGKQHAHAARDHKADAHDAVDALAVAAAPVLADEHA